MININITKIDHIGIAISNDSLEKSIDFYKHALNLKFKGEETIDSEGIKVFFFESGETNIELLTPLPNNDQSSVAKFLKNKGEGMHHMAYLTDNIQNAISWFISKGYRLINEQPKIGAHGKKIAFLHPKETNGVLIELCEVNH